MKRTATLIVKGECGDYGQTWLPKGKITCEVTGEMNTGEKVWTDLETGEQYFLTRMLGKYMFFHI